MRHRLRARPVHHRRGRERAPAPEAPSPRRGGSSAPAIEPVVLERAMPNDQVAVTPVFRRDDPDAFVVDWAPPTA